MERIAIIGPAGAGKTTLARKLNKISNINVYHLDRLLWKTGWQSIDGASRIDIMQSLIRENRWIIEGTYLNSSAPRLAEADTIIFLDVPIYTCFWRLIQRHRNEHGQFRRDIPEQSVDKLDLHRIYRLFVFCMRERKQLIQKLRAYNLENDPGKVRRFHSDKEVSAFLMLYKQIC